MHMILFLCTGNYYRSRLAECVFNHLAQQNNLPWRADSRGLRVQPDGVVNPGPISIFTQTALQSRRIPRENPLRFPAQVSAAELAAATIIIALKEKEHRPLFEKLHPDFADRVRYWHVHDLDAALPAEALAQIETQIRDLITEISIAAQPGKI